MTRFANLVVTQWKDAGAHLHPWWTIDLASEMTFVETTFISKCFR